MRVFIETTLDFLVCKQCALPPARPPCGGDLPIPEREKAREDDIDGATKLPHAYGE